MGGTWGELGGTPCTSLLLATPIPGLRTRRGIPEAGENKGLPSTRHREDEEAACPEGPPRVPESERVTRRVAGHLLLSPVTNPAPPPAQFGMQPGLGREGDAGSPQPASPQPQHVAVGTEGRQPGRGAPGSAAAVPPQGGVAPRGALQLREGERAQREGARAHEAEAEPLVEGHQSVLTHEHGPAHVRLAAQVVQVAPHQHGALALPPASVVHGQHVQVGGAAPGPVQRQRLLGTGRDVSPDPLLPIPASHPSYPHPAESKCLLSASKRGSLPTRGGPQIGNSTLHPMEGPS